MREGLTQARLRQQVQESVRPRLYYVRGSIARKKHPEHRALAIRVAASVLDRTGHKQPEKLEPGEPPGVL
jgi:hypothetical protein